jgi:hypothetical protein
MSTNWRDFEEMVAKIEQDLAPKGATVKSPDRVRDLVTGKLREVDASIRFDIGSTPVLITIECRKRRGVQDDTWIEQLATKRDKIGAARTIAVSATGFSASAIKTAKLYSIELRSLKDRISEEIVQEFLSGLKFTVIVHEYATESITFQLDDDSWLPQADFGDDLSAAISNGGIHATLAREPATGKIVTMDSILGRVSDDRIPRDGTPLKGRVDVGFPPRTVQISTKHGPRFLAKAVIVASFTCREIPAPATSVYEYAKPEGPIRHTIEAVAPISDTEAIQLSADVSSTLLSKRPEASKAKGRKKK